MCPILLELLTRGETRTNLCTQPWLPGRLWCPRAGVPAPRRCGGRQGAGLGAFPEQLLPSAGEGKTPGSGRGIVAGSLAQLRRRIGC